MSPHEHRRPAATVVLLRDGARRGIEVLLVRRHAGARFVPGSFVFPGGAVDAADGWEADAARALRAAGARECEEEAGVRPAVDDLVPVSRWITPPAVQPGFDTRFFAGPAPAGQVAVADGVEVVEVRWMAPGGALAAEAAGEISLTLPTRATLGDLLGFEDVASTLAAFARREPPRFDLRDDDVLRAVHARYGRGSAATDP